MKDKDSRFLAYAKVLHPEWLGGLSLREATLDVRVPFGDCLGIMDALCGGLATSTREMLVQAVSYAPAGVAAFVDVHLALYRPVSRRVAPVLLNRTELRVREVRRGPTLWGVGSKCRGCGVPAVETIGSPEIVCDCVATMLELQLASWVCDKWGISRPEAETMLLDAGRQPPACLRPVSLN